MTAVLYAGRGSTTTASDLYTVNPATGVCTSLGPTGFGLTGIAEDPTDPTKLYGATNFNSASDPFSLILLNKTTGAGTLIGAFGHNIADIAFDNTGQLYGIDPSLHRLWKINKATGALTLVGGGLTSGNGFGFAIDSANNARNFKASNFYSINLATAAEAFLGSTGFGAPTAASYDSVNALWAVDTPNPPGTSDLYTVNPANGSPTHQSTLSVTLVDALGWGTAPSGGPAISSFTPESGPIGTPVVITGSGFTGATDVLFNGTSVLSFTVDSPTQITTSVPPGTTSGTIEVVSGGSAFSVDSFIVTVASGFYQGYQWRFIVTNLQLDVLSWMQGLMTNRRILLTANQSAVIDTDVFPDDFRVNGLVFDPGTTTKSFPRLAQSNRIIFAYRREGDSSFPGVTPWQCKAAGIIMSLEDQADTDVPLSHVTAYDPWKLLEARPAMNALGELPGQLGFESVGPGSTTALQYLKDTIENEGGVYIDAGVSWGGTSYYGSAGGVLETTPDVVMTVQQGQSVADVWSALVEGGNMDIQLIPIYDPLRQIVVDGTVYFFTHELSIKNVAGSEKPKALMGWDKLNHCINRIDRMHDATPGAFFDKIQYFAGQGGVPVPLTPLVDSATLAEFGSYWSQQFFPSLLSADPTGSMTYALAVLALRLVKQGRRTLTLDLSSGLGPIPLTDYDIFDLVPVHASEALRVTVDGYLKVEAIPITIDDNGVESVNGLVLSPDYRTQAYP